MLMRKRWLTKADTRLLIAVILLSLVAYVMIKISAGYASAEKQAVVEVSGKIVRQFDVAEDTAMRMTIWGKTRPTTIEVQKGRMRVLEAFCPDQLCVKQGWISGPGQSIVCVPNELVIYFQDNDDSGLDGITR